MGSADPSVRLYPLNSTDGQLALSERLWAWRLRWNRGPAGQPFEVTMDWISATRTGRVSTLVMGSREPDPQKAEQT